MELRSLNTPAALIDVERMKRNIERMQERMNALGVSFRPHVKTTKCKPVINAQLDAGARGITVSTLKEAEQFFASGIRDIVYAVGMAPTKLEQALALRRQGCDLKIIADSVACAEAIVAFGREHEERFEGQQLVQEALDILERIAHASRADDPPARVSRFRKASVQPHTVAKVTSFTKANRWGDACHCCKGFP